MSTCLSKVVVPNKLFFLFGLSHCQNICTAENSYTCKVWKKSDQNTLLYQCTILLDMQKHEIIVKVHFGDI